MIIYLIATLSVVGLAVGQILFKASATALSESGTFFAIKPAAMLFAAMCLYGVTSIAWVWVLQKVELGRVYPLMALAFVLVPLGSHLVFGERFQHQYFIGVAMIVFGIFVSVRV
ncbi:4-amino-4-deoxy-L-arabinose-phospho-UDP flippase [Metapseudomonas otitidis]|uniref:4-amino-4-deoxy-L-arabinose-phospho-UDP flippase n=1 Tax=Metapseudomonas otitidis TaxID=319939 RepID=UPI001F44028C|nr:4-amino-4-deoxy-L-arabinose-phospho-UDP flippase [Pseudomonas otitidis]